MLHLACFSVSPACVYPLCFLSLDQPVGKHVFLKSKQSSKSLLAWVQNSPLPFQWEEENLPQSNSSVNWAPLSDLPPCTGKAGSIDFIRHRSVGLSVCLSCIPHIPKPPCLLSAFSAPLSSFPLWNSYCYCCEWCYHTPFDPSKFGFLYPQCNNQAVTLLTKHSRSAFLSHLWAVIA